MNLLPLIARNGDEGDVPRVGVDGDGQVVRGVLQGVGDQRVLGLVRVHGLHTAHNVANLRSFINFEHVHIA